MGCACDKFKVRKDTGQFCLQFRKLDFGKLSPKEQIVSICTLYVNKLYKSPTPAIRSYSTRFFHVLPISSPSSKTLAVLRNIKEHKSSELSGRASQVGYSPRIQEEEPKGF